ncbi:MAG: hypothetical protein IT209_09420 [Armatimonadetes bacterium]|nr:hypothetical protein [Armatimonadota bacterium]
MGSRISVQHVRDIRVTRNARRLLREELTRARSASGRKCLQCALDNVPKDAVVVTWRKALTGRALHKDGLLALEAPRPRTRKALYIFLHECAHLHLHCNTSKPRHRKEYEAEMYAHSQMRAAGIPVPESMTEAARRYVAWKIQQALARGAVQIDPDASRFAARALQTLHSHAGRNDLKDR